MSLLRASASDLRDLTQGAPALVEATRGVPTGATLLRYIGAGGMSAVFLAEIDPAKRSTDLSPLAPRRIAIKFMQADTEKELVKYNMDPLAIFVKEAVALGRVMERKPPTEFVVGFYGSGRADVQIGSGAIRRLPWLAIELVDGGTAGTSLTDRVRRAHEGIDPIRALRLARGIIEGVRVLHAERIVHRDLKPDNVLVAGPLDDETPKLADCGIARIEGMPGMTIAAMTPEYGGPEQAISIPGQANPLVGRWTDIHALSAVLWFIIAGEPWCTSNVDRAWHAGERRSLRTAARLHPAFVMNPALLHQLDDVLARGAACRLPAAAWNPTGPGQKESADRLLVVARGRYPSMFAGPERYADVDAFGAELFPLLEQIAAAWTSRAARENHAATAFRPTQMLRADELAANAPPATVREIPASDIDGTHSSFGSPQIEPARAGGVVFQPDGKVLARFGDRLIYFVSNEPHKVGVPEELRDVVRLSRWLVRGPGGGFALVGPTNVLLVKGGRMTPMRLPTRAGGGEVGEIQAVLGDGRVFGVVTAETDDSNGGPELWRSTDGTAWTAPTVLPLGGDAHAFADGPFGVLVVGSRKGTRGRALFLGLDEQTNVFTTGVNDKPALRVALCGAARESWAAGEGIVLRLERGAAVAEKTEASDVPAAMALDLVGVPWLVTEHAVLRRHVENNEGIWRAYYRRDPSRPPLVGIGFTPQGANVLDARGGSVEIEPHDIASWSARASQR
jgi:serine/threonine protein kinase